MFKAPTPPGGREAGWWSGSKRGLGLQGRNRGTDVKNKRMDTKGGKWWGGGGGGGMNWEIGIDIYTLICIT